MDAAVLDAPVAAPVESSPAPAVTETAPAAPAAPDITPELEAVETFVAEPEAAPEVKPEEAAPEAAKEPEKLATPPIEEFAWDPTPGVKLLNKGLEASPGLRAELEKNPPLKNFIYASARARDEAMEYGKHFLSPSQAEEAARRSVELAGYEQAFDAGGLTLAKVLHQRNAEKYFSLAEQVTTDRRAEFRKEATALERYDWIEALDLIEQAENEIKGIVPPTDIDKLPADVKAQLEQAKADRLLSEKAQTQANAVLSDRTVNACRDAVKQRHMPYLKSISGSLPAETLERVFTAAYKEFAPIVNGNNQFLISKDGLWNRYFQKALSPDDTVKQISTLTANNSSAIRGILARLVKEEAKKFVGASKVKNEVLTQRTQERREPKGAAAAAVPTPPATADQLVARAQEEKIALFKAGKVTSSRLTSDETVSAIDGSLFRQWAKLLK
jgi:hypothetical protein